MECPLCARPKQGRGGHPRGEQRWAWSVQGCSQFSVIPALRLWGSFQALGPWFPVLWGNRTPPPKLEGGEGLLSRLLPTLGSRHGANSSFCSLTPLTATGCLIKDYIWFPAAKQALLPSAPPEPSSSVLLFPLALQPPPYLRQSSPIIPSSQRARRGGVIQMPSDISEALIKGRLCMPFEL